MRSVRRSLASALAALALLFHLQPAGAGDAAYPARPITFVVGFAAGGESDRVARLLAAKLAPAFGEPIVVHNRPGAGGDIAASEVARAPADGYTLLLGSMGPLAVAASMRNTPGYDVSRAFAPISLVGAFDQVLVVHPSVPVHSLAEFIAYAKTHPGKMSYASTGIGSASHLAGLLLERLAGLDMLHVPYQGALKISRDLIAGDVLASFAPAQPIKPYVQAGRLRALARTGPMRMRDWPELPTFAELGFPQYEVTDWYALVAPAATPTSILDGWNRELVGFLSSAEGRQALEALGMRAMPTTRARAASFVERERRRWRELLIDHGQLK
jgi:tripartite-type tricarboxylate transporter receptor subunit TctC